MTMSQLPGLQLSDGADSIDVTGFIEDLHTPVIQFEHITQRVTPHCGSRDTLQKSLYTLHSRA